MPAGGADAPIRILHLSDAHFSEGSAWDSDPLLREAIDYIRREVAAGLTPDLVALTGDLAYAGKEAEYKLAQDWLDRLWAVLPQDLPRDRLLIVPGNHDVDRNLVTRSNRIMQDGLLQEASQDHIAEVCKGEDDLRLLVKRQAEYRRFTEKWRGATQALPWWQRTINIRGTSIHVAGLNSAWMSWQEEDRGKLLVGRYQINQTVRAADARRADFRISLLHHPWDYLREFDARETRALIHQHTDIVLRGHLHATSGRVLRSARSTEGLHRVGGRVPLREQRLPQRLAVDRIGSSGEGGAGGLPRLDPQRLGHR